MKVTQKINITQAALAGGNLAKVNIINVEGRSSGPIITLEAILIATPGPTRLDRIVRNTIQAALNLFDGNARKAATYLGISPHTISRYSKSSRSVFISRKKAPLKTLDLTKEEGDKYYQKLLTE